MDIQDIERKVGLDNDAGLKTKLYFGRSRDVNVWPTVPETMTVLADKVTLEGDFEMKVGTRFGFIEGHVEKNSFTNSGAGQVGNSSAANQLTFFMYGTDPDVLGWIETYKNDDLVLIAEDLQGNLRVYGAEGLPAQIMPDWQEVGGASVADEKMIQINFRYVGRIAKFYSGAIPLTEAVEP
ncbi:hypothetical protein PBT90_16690 [Algoriphagus halophytocola]|uniref:hypothetical protein n=1 Tax=Algoriphagus halophytocola TaxID=2991499 RepID=UPI0022DDB1A9|nr:hypothetical protein [Algoriphagus sp. TR-M9]WBL42375.1 hypothetical protein PBT90_16690 [Algoriphagus sp. TR-M9]